MPAPMVDRSPRESPRPAGKGKYSPTSPTAHDLIYREVQSKVPELTREAFERISALILNEQTPSPSSTPTVSPNSESNSHPSPHASPDRTDTRQPEHKQTVKNVAEQGKEGQIVETVRARDYYQKYTGAKKDGEKLQKEKRAELLTEFLRGYDKFCRKREKEPTAIDFCDALGGSALKVVEDYLAENRNASFVECKQTLIAWELKLSTTAHSWRQYVEQTKRESTLEDYYFRLKRRADIYREYLGEKYPESDMCSMLIKQIPDESTKTTARTYLLTHPHKLLPLYTFLAKVTDDSVNNTRRKPKDRNRGGNKAHKGGGKNTPTDEPKISKKPCPVCGSQHFARDCSVNASFRKKGACTNCGFIGHRHTECEVEKRDPKKVPPIRGRLKLRRNGGKTTSTVTSATDSPPDPPDKTASAIDAEFDKKFKAYMRKLWEEERETTLAQEEDSE